MAGVLGILKCSIDKTAITGLLDENEFGVTVRE
jgi:hypothetical protein